MTSPARSLAVLDLFSRKRSVWQPDEINEALGYTRATVYRLGKDLVGSGFLQTVSVSRYGLGGRIIELDYPLRQSNPVLLAACGRGWPQRLFCSGTPNQGRLA